MLDQFERQIEYLRISITDRCNLRCRYCMPAAGVSWLAPSEILSYEEILRLIAVSTKMGFHKFRITGGEPLVRKGVTGFLARVSETQGVDDLTVTTNGMLLESMAPALKKAGVKRVNVSLDTLDAAKFAEITRGGELSKVLAGIEKAFTVGLQPVKLNVVVMRDFNDMELGAFVDLARKYPLHVRFIELMPIGESSGKLSKLVTIEEMKRIIGLDLAPVEGLAGAGPAQHFSGPMLKGSIGFISAISQHFCARCNRVRLTADGKLKPCLHSTDEFDLRPLLRSNASDEELRQALEAAIWQKPSQHHMAQEGWQGRKRVMSQIGG